MDAKITEAEMLLTFADPEGYFRSGTRAAAEARSRGLRQHALEQQRAQEEVGLRVCVNSACSLLKFTMNLRSMRKSSIIAMVI